MKTKKIQTGSPEQLSGNCELCFLHWRLRPTMNVKDSSGIETGSKLNHGPRGKDTPDNLDETMFEFQVSI